MNLKKTLAALSAGVVAVASMATLAASAQEAGSRTFDTFDVMYHAKGTISATMASNVENTTFTVDLDRTVFDNAGWKETVRIDTDADGIPDSDALAFGDLKVTKLKIGGDTYTDEEEINTYVTTDKIAGTVTITALGLEKGKVANVTIEVKSPKYEAKADAQKMAEKAAKLGDNEVKMDDGDITTTTTDGNNPAVLTVEGGKASVKVATDKFFLQINCEPDGTNVKGDEWSKLDGTPTVWAIDKSARLKNLDTEVANTLASNRGAKLVFYFKDKRDAEEEIDSAPDYDQDTGWSDGKTEDFAIRVNGTKALKGIGMVDADALTISFDWDTVLSNSNLTNAVGQVDTIEFKANKDGFLYDEDYDKDKDDATFAYEITKIVVEWPASDAVADDMSDLAAGEAETTVEAALPGADAAATTAAAATTDAAANPSTGNSAVALAVIPVAIAAAAFVAKKRG